MGKIVIKNDIRLGGITPTNLYFNQVEPNKVYFGSQLVWEKIDGGTIDDPFYIKNVTTGTLTVTITKSVGVA